MEEVEKTYNIQNIPIVENYDIHDLYCADLKPSKIIHSYDFEDKLHVITETPYKKENQEFFRNIYGVIVNHNTYDEGCHVDVFQENELELYTEKLQDDSSLIFLSEYLKGKIKLENISWRDIECGRITLNENKSFRDIPEIKKFYEKREHI